MKERKRERTTAVQMYIYVYVYISTRIHLYWKRVYVMDGLTSLRGSSRFYGFERRLCFSFLFSSLFSFSPFYGSKNRDVHRPVYIIHACLKARWQSTILLGLLSACIIYYNSIIYIYTNLRNMRTD